MEARKASTRSFGVGDKDIRDEENRLIKEREMRTILIGQQDKPSQRNVGMQVCTETVSNSLIFNYYFPIFFN